MRTKLANNNEVAHYFFNKVQYEGEGSNFFFRDDTLYSYGYHFPLAKFIKDDVVFFNNRSYSVSTAKHQSIARSAIPSYVKVFYVNSPTDNYNSIVSSWIKDIEDLIKKANRARTNKAYYLRSAGNIIDSAEEFVKLFKCKSKLKSSDKRKLNEFITNRDKLLTDNVKAKLDAEIKREKLAKKRKADQIKKDNQQYIEQWRKLERSHLNNSYNLPIMLRINGDIIESSRSASVSVKEAELLYKAINHGKDIKGLKIGHYKGVGYTPNKVIIGCHNIPMSEVKTIAKQLNW